MIKVMTVIGLIILDNPSGPKRITGGKRVVREDVRMVAEKMLH